MDNTFNARIARSTDVKKNKDDPYGDGDQSMVTGMGYGGDAQEDLRNVWSAGGDFNPASPPGSGSAAVSDFCRSCFFGDVAMVTSAIKSTAAGSEQRTHLLELHESVLRLTPLLSCIVGAPPLPLSPSSASRLPPPLAHVPPFELPQAKRLCVRPKRVCVPCRCARACLSAQSGKPFGGRERAARCWRQT
jgi:hypothetical protein